MAEAELRNMIMNFRVSDLQVLLTFAGRNKTGKKQELQSRALELLKNMSAPVDMKVRELHNRRYHNQLIPRPTNYDIQERALNERPIMHFDSSMNNNYATRCNTSVRPTHVTQPPSYSTKPQFIPPVPDDVPSYYTYTDVKFKELPFYDILHVVIRPRILSNVDATDRTQETTHTFNLQAQEAHDIAVSRESPGSFDCHLLLRFCLLDTTSEQDDNFPSNISVKVNNKPVPLPNPVPTNRPGVEPKRPSKPVNITPFAKLSPNVTNTLAFSWNSVYGRTHVFALFVARQLNSRTLLQRLKDRGMKNPDFTTVMIKEKSQQGQDSDIAMTSLKGPLICPLGKVKMNLPCRAVSCTHIQCFDASLYIQMNEKKPKWICPVCDKPALWRSLAIDGLFMDIITKVPSECTEVQFHEDGSWTPIMPVKDSKDGKKSVIEKGPKKQSQSLKKPVEVVEIDSESDSEEMWPQGNINYSRKIKSGECLPPISPPLVLVSPTSNGIPHPVIPSATSYSGSTSSITSIHDALQLPSGMSTSDPDTLILPDIVNSLPDNSYPSTSVSSPGLVSTSYAPGPYSQGDASVSSYCPPTYQNSSAYNAAFDLFSLIQPSEHDQQRELEPSEKDTEPSSPDVISLE